MEQQSQLSGHYQMAYLNVLADRIKGYPFCMLDIGGLHVEDFYCFLGGAFVAFFGYHAFLYAV